MNATKAREMAIRILGEFEELLAGKGVMIPSDVREGREEKECIYGTEYYELEDAITDILVGFICTNGEVQSTMIHLT